MGPNVLISNKVPSSMLFRRGRTYHVERGKGRRSIELIVADDGVGMKDKDSVKVPEKRGSDYVAIFVRQLGGTIAPSVSQGTGTIVKIRLPLLLVPPGGAERVPA
jgi:two-component sensor histidine kinase